MNLVEIGHLGSDLSSVISGLAQFPVDHLALLYDPRDSALSDLSYIQARVGVEVRLHPAINTVEVLRTVRQILQNYSAGHNEILVNVTPSEGNSPSIQTGLVMASFLNGLSAFIIERDEVVRLPLIQFEARERFGETKLRILHHLDGMGGEAGSLSELADEAGVERSLLSYHLRGGKRSPGLEDLGLISLDRNGKQVVIQLTPKARVLLVGQPSNRDGPSVDLPQSGPRDH